MSTNKLKLRAIHKGIVEKLSTFEADFENNWKTHCQFRFNPAYTGNSATNVKNIKSLEDLIVIDSYIRVKAEAYEESAIKTFGLTKDFPTFLWQECTYSDWAHDLTKQYRIISSHDRKNALIEAKKRLEDVFDVEDKRAMLIDSMCDLGLDIKALGCGDDDEVQEVN
jgi:hypothetical protein